MSIITYFSKKKYNLYKRTYTVSGAGEEISWERLKVINAYIEPAEKLTGSELGDYEEAELVLYTTDLIRNKEIVEIRGEYYEIRSTEFWQIPYMTYYKGYLVKTDEDISI